MKTPFKKTSLILTGSVPHSYESILTNDALCFIELLELKFRETRQTLLSNREKNQSEIDSGGFPDFLLETEEIRSSDWKINPMPNDLLDRRVNLIVFFDKNWIAEKGGYLELWDMEKKLRIENISPDFNRCVIFETNEISFHGHPKPLKINSNESRKSLSIYYYTKGRNDIGSIDSHNTIYTNTESTQGAFKIFNNGIKHFFRKFYKLMKRS